MARPSPRHANAAPKTKKRKAGARKGSRSAAPPSPDSDGQASDAPPKTGWRFGAAASDIVHRAASILEEEIAAGIVAAKQVEARFVRKTEVRDEAPRDDLMQRLRKDAHEAVDMLMDLFSTLSRNVAELTTRASAATPKDEPKRGSTARTAAPSPESVRISAAPGAEGRATLRVVGRDPVAALRKFIVTDLVSEPMDRIPSSCAVFEPDAVMLSTRNTADIEVVLRIPTDAPRGSYTGLIMWGSGESSRAVVEVLVE